MIGFIFFHYLKRMLKEPITLGILIALPVVLIVILSSVFGDNFEGEAMVNGYNMISTHIAVPLLIAFQFYGGAMLIDFLHNDFRTMRKARLFSTPVKNSHFLIGALLGSLLASLLQGFAVIGVSHVFLDVYFGNMWITLLALMLSAIIAQLLVLVGFIMISNKSTTEVLISTVAWGMMAGSGLMFGPVENPHPILEFLMTYLPLSLGVNAINEAGFIDGYDLSAARDNLGILFIYALILGIIVLALSKRLNAESNKAKAKTEQPEKKPTDLPMPQMLDLNLNQSQSTRTHFTVLKFGIFRGLKNWMSLTFNMILPIGLIFIPELWSEDTRGFYFVAGGLMIGSLPACKSLLNDKLEGTYQRIHLAPISKASYLLQSIISGFIPLFIPVIIITITGFFKYNWGLELALAIFMLYTLFSMASVALILAWRNIFSNKESSMVAFSVIMSLVAMVGGVWIPLEMMPSGLRVIGAFFPIYWLSTSIDSLLTSGISWSYMMNLMILLLFITAFTLFGIKGRKEGR